MEKLKSAVPHNLKRQIYESTTPAHLPSTCSSLLLFFRQLPLFHQVVKDLADCETMLCGKSKDAALESKKKGNQCFANADYSTSLRFYSQALRDAPADADDMGNNLILTLYVNRATVLHKMGFLMECLRDCNRALQICPSHSKAWYRRGKANASLGSYEDAVLDFTVAMNMELSVGGKRQIENELKVLLGKNKEKNISPCSASVNSLDDELLQIKLQCVTTPTKGRSMVSLTDIHQASLLHTEEPYAAIILKPCRDTHCHFCFNKLPVDTVPCMSCTIPLYCSQQCQAQARSQKTVRSSPRSYGGYVCLPDDLREHVANVTTSSVSSSYNEDISEHEHECGGVNWSAVLPSELVLAGRILMKYFKQHRHFPAAFDRVECLDLCHNYGGLPSDVKLQLHIRSVVLLYCLRHSCCNQLHVNEISLSQCVILLSQIKVNTMAIVRLNFVDVHGTVDQSAILSSVGNCLTSTVEQVKVGQAIYSAGSLYNHSCRPNIHAYFLSRTLYLRSTKFIASGSQLELSYGPQVGQWDCKDRQQFLADHYSFKCQCSSCSEVNLSDLVFNAFRCVKPNCFGVVLDRCLAMYEKQKGNPYVDKSINTNDCLRPHVQILKIMKLKNGDISEVAQHLFQQTDCIHQFEHGKCLTCGSFLDLDTLSKGLKKAETNVRRLKDAIVANQVSTATLSYGLGSLDLYRSTLHAYNKKIAELEDDLAHAFCLAGELQHAKDHCKASIKILEKLYNRDHIVIGNEMVKLTSIQLALGEVAAIDSINRVDEIFFRYYGPHTYIIFSHLQDLKREAFKLAE